MRFEPGFVKELKLDIESIRPELRAKMRRTGGLSEEKLVSLVSNAISEEIDIVHADLPSKRDLVNYRDLHQWQAGCDAMRAGEVAFVVLAGGAGTRAGGPKAFMRLPNLGMTLMANKLMQSSLVTHEGEVLQAPTWFMTSPALFEKMALHLGGLSPTVEGAVFEQYESYRLRVDNRIDFSEPGVPNFHPTGHGDVGPALIESGVLSDYPNVKHCIIVNCDNVLASIDPIVLSYHIEAKNDVTIELVERKSTDAGGAAAWVDGRLQVIEDFRLSEGVRRAASFQNTNTMIINVDVLKRPIEWRWNRVRKQVNSQLVVQYERLIQQYTEFCKTEYVLMDRDRRYLPVKVEEDLLRADEVLNGNKRW